MQTRCVHGEEWCQGSRDLISTVYPVVCIIAMPRVTLVRIVGYFCESAIGWGSLTIYSPQSALGIDTLSFSKAPCWTL